jgi:hypothetical protein
MLKLVLTLRHKFAWLYRLGLLRRATAFRWEMDLSLGELSSRSGHVRASVPLR